MTNHLASLRYRPTWFTKKPVSSQSRLSVKDTSMSVNLFIVAFTKDEVAKHPALVDAVATNKPIEDMTVSLLDEKEIAWISPRIGNVSEGMDKHMPVGSGVAVAVTREQIKKMLDDSRDVARRDKPHFHDPEGFYAYLMEEFTDAEKLIGMYPEDTIFFAYQI